MAGDWLKWSKGLPKKPEVVSIAADLSMSRRETAAMLMELWEWVDDVSHFGHVPSVTKTFVDELLSVTGAADAIEKTGWLEVCDDGSLHFPNFDRHNGKTAKQRVLAAERKRRERENVSRNERDKSVTREEKRRGKEKVPKRTARFDPLGVELPDNLRLDSFRVAWSEWCAHRVEIKKPLTPTSTKQQLQRLSEWGVARSIAAISHTIEKGWQGIQEPDRNGKHAAEDPQPTRRPPLLTERSYA